jgi:hypothetical protein
MPDLDEVTEPRMEEIVFAAIDRKLRGVHTAAPGKIVAYDSASQTATVQLTVEIEVREGAYEPVPPLLEVPVIQPLTGGFYLHLPPSPGDGVVVHFFESDPSAWLLKGSTEPPALARRHGFYPVAVLGAPPLGAELTAAQAPATAAVLAAKSGTAVSVESAAVRLGAIAATDPVALATALDAWLTSVVTWLDAHTHAVTTAPGTTAPPVPSAPTAPTTAATKVFGV